ncbi:hypothetical protein CONPUDRAFT_75210 [Coniophora puteana RWD-64-598 SS2]|uniref:Uncharacterized protein n=1 Tax=Coniophora puteana (strain RWD-64-598) TaxID=741705 RepID=A0A5M3MIX5_CONPW|nr:uncharacterized protein CONPUDRAFT_75210 [Coniophora puteana RWD-64-598 SS2]EIW78571.1 hypothetical protein CONPUDRAFT_75210 [Coniophora puteana RWD-64-598 SS2]
MASQTQTRTQNSRRKSTASTKTIRDSRPVRTASPKAARRMRPPRTHYARQVEHRRGAGEPINTDESISIAGVLTGLRARWVELKRQTDPKIGLCSAAYLKGPGDDSGGIMAAPSTRVSGVSFHVRSAGGLCTGGLSRDRKVNSERSLLRVTDRELLSTKLLQSLTEELKHDEVPTAWREARRRGRTGVNISTQCLIKRPIFFVQRR